MQEDIINLLAWLGRWCVRLTWRASKLGTRQAAQLTARALPAATNTGAAAGFALLGGAVWFGLVTVVFGLFGSFSVGAIAGCVVGVCIAYALTKRGLAQVHAHAGGISLGE